MKSITNFLTENKNDVLEEILYAVDKISLVDAVINGLEEVLKEHKDELSDGYSSEISKLHELQELMENIVSDIYDNEQ